MATFSAVGTGTSGAPNYTLTLTVNETSYSTFRHGVFQLHVMLMVKYITKLYQGV